MKFVLYIYVLIMTLGNIFAQNNFSDIRFKRLGLKEGLSQSRISAIVQDSKGFMWFGTEDGLNRYDGYQFEVFTFDPKDSTSLANNVITALAADDSGNIWIGTAFGGLNRYIARSGTFINYRHDPMDSTSITNGRIEGIHRNADGDLWIVLLAAEEVFDFFDHQTQTFMHYRYDPQKMNSVISDRINFIFEDSRGSVWIGTQDGLDRYYPATNTYRHYLAERSAKKSINHPNVTCAFEDRQGFIWFGTAGGGLNKFDPRTESFSYFLLNKNNPDSPGNLISAILESRDGGLWIGTWGGGLYHLETHANQLRRYQHSPTDINSISEDYITALYEDRTGEIWVGTDLNGINKIDRSATKFRTISVIHGQQNSLSINQVRAFWQDDNGILWLGTAGGGLDRYDRQNNMFKNYRRIAAKENSLSSNLVRAIYQDEKGIFWLGTGRGLNRFDPKAETFLHIYPNPQNPDDPVNLINYRILELFNYPGYIWFGSSGAGLCRYDVAKNVLKRFQHDPAHPQSQQLDIVRTLYHSKYDPNILWVGGFGGFSCFDLSTETFISYSNDPDNPKSLSSNNIMGFHEDKAGNLWIATYGGGINYFNPKTEEFIIITKNNSDLPSNSVYGFLPDNNGYLWLSSNRGISRFDPRTYSFKNYTVEDGLQSDEFNGGAYYQSKTGEMFFGGINGINIFYPESISDNPFKPQIELTDFKIFNQSIPIADDSPLQQHISVTKELQLAYWQNDIEIEFVALHYYRPSNNHYTYRLDNYDEDWRYVGPSRSAVYTNLDPGEYRFQVNAANSDGVWNSEGPKLKIIINPPWWSTSWAYIGYGLIFILSVVAVDRVQRSRLTHRERQRALIREADLRAKVAEDENERKSRELEEARRLQLSLLPEKLPVLPDLEIAVYMKTATEVGGDYYDYSISADGTLNIAIGDATGHGMQAGTIVTLMKGLFKADSGRMDINAFFRQSSETIKDLRFGRLMMSFSLLKIKNNQMLLSSAGMPPSYLYNSATLKVQEISFEGMPLGAMTDFKYTIKQEKLNRGDTLLLLSDGLPELKNPDGEMFGYQRVEEVFRDVAGQPAQIIADRLADAGEIWRKNRPVDDDITLMIIRMH